FYSGLQIRKEKELIENRTVPIIDNHIEGVSVVFAKCCHPIQGDPVIAHSDTERGIVVHHQRCKQVSPYINKDPRYFSAYWEPSKKSHLYLVMLKITTENKIGVLSDIVSIFAKAGINIEQVNTKAVDQKFSEFTLEVNIESLDELKRIMSKVRSKKFTASCSRIINDK
ncbi:ACT domain-containing protein, partial [Gammaproteobacteria bacterium]|nr:ACT domain-containing protein [Gammaproteobacteria bacterium]